MQPHRILVIPEDKITRELIAPLKQLFDQATFSASVREAYDSVYKDSLSVDLTRRTDGGKVGCYTGLAFLKMIYRVIVDPKPILEWKAAQYGALEAVLLNPDGTPGVLFSLECRPTCYRRGPYLLRIMVADGPFHIFWGCFDEQDEPVRNYHDRDVAILEAERIACVLLKDFDSTKEHPREPVPDSGAA